MGNVVPAPGSMANLEIMRKVGGFDENIPYSNDYDLWVRLAATGLPFKHVERYTCKYRWHQSNVSHRADMLAVDDLKILNKMIGTYEIRQLCADLDWNTNARRAEIQACERIYALLSRKNDQEAARSWEYRRNLLCAELAAAST
jgi:hypothetical protein